MQAFTSVFTLHRWLLIAVLAALVLAPISGVAFGRAGCAH